jgi:TPP-dependent pyruvate/acetoin dehydrogenase alpha subunit
MHIADASVGLLGANGIVGGGLPIAVGAGLSAKLRGADQVAVCFFGDGAGNQGTFHESLNLAAIWKLPVLFLLENNFYGMGTPVSKVCATPDIYKHPQIYGIRSVQMKQTDEAVQLIRSGEGPFFLECVTYRHRGHSMSDPELYRNKAEVEHWREMDPIKRFSELLLQGTLTQADIDRISEQIEQEVDDCVTFAEESPFPPLESLTNHVYAPSPLDSMTGQGGNTHA